MDLPAGAFTETGQQTIEIIGSLLRALVGADVTGHKTIANGQQIHTTTCSRVDPSVSGSGRGTEQQTRCNHWGFSD